MAYTFDYINSLINVVAPETAVTCQDLYNSIAQEQASEDGICFSQITTASGNNPLSQYVQVGVTLLLLGQWQLSFPAGNYMASVSGGNLFATNTNGPVAYSAGVQILLIQSSNNTVISPGSVTIDSSALFSTPNPPGTFPVGSVGQQIQKSAALAGIALNV